VRLRVTANPQNALAAFPEAEKTRAKGGGVGSARSHWVCSDAPSGRFSQTDWPGHPAGPFFRAKQHVVNFGNTKSVCWSAEAEELKPQTRCAMSKMETAASHSAMNLILNVRQWGDAMAVNETVEVKCSECGKQGRVGTAFQYLTDPRPRCNRGIPADKALRCPALLRAFSEARSKLKRG
jgi:hypothetical protein